MILEEADYLAHYGILRKSGRYPWGSGGTQSIRNKTFLDCVDELKRSGMSEKAIVEAYELDSIRQLRALKSIALNEQRQSKINQAQRLRDKGESKVAIGKRMGLNESSVRSLLEAGEKDKANVLMATSNMLRDQVEKKELIDVGTGVENHIGITRTKLQTAVAVLEEEGYKVHYLKVPQLTPGQYTTQIVLSKPGVSYSDVYKNKDKVQQITSFSDDGGRSHNDVHPPVNLSAKRIAVAYDNNGGAEKDGVIEVRPGVDDLSLGGSNYAQVRIAVNGTHYLKGMVVYNNDLPPGVDVRFNTSKKDSGNKLDAMKPMEKKPDGSIDLENPFGASIKPGGQRGVFNILKEEGEWDTHTKTLSRQMLSKQNPELAKTQLDMMYERKRSEFDEIMALTNPVVKKKLLTSFSDDVDSSAVHMKAHALPRQETRVLLPVNSVKEHEVYDPSFHNGDRVALIRFPHGGTFEIPELTVNNRNVEAKKLLGTSAKDAIGINSKVAERLSGADFDGDFVLVIPNNKGSIKTTPALEGLKGFDPRRSFPPYDGMRTIDGGTYNATTKSVDFTNRSGNQKQGQMGHATNLIADMTVRGANNEEKARAIRHSMVVIDAEKHHLDYKSSAKDNGIAQLKAKYQVDALGDPKGGASTLITRATGQAQVLGRKPRSAANGGPIDRATGKKVYEYTGKTYVNKKGVVVPTTKRSRQLAETDDAHTLSSGTLIEGVYADHSNKLKALGNTARKEMLSIQTEKVSPSAKVVYSKEIETLNHKLNVAQMNRPLERQAQVIARSMVDLKRQANPHMDDADVKKIKRQALAAARNRTGAKKQRIDLTQAEWDAIQAGAISTNKLEKILNNSDLDVVKKLATPKTKLKMTTTKTNRAKAMLAQGYTQAEVASQLGVSLSTLKVGLEA